MVDVSEVAMVERIRKRNKRNRRQRPPKGSGYNETIGSFKHRLELAIAHILWKNFVVAPEYT